MRDTILVDTGAWIALFDPREEQHQAISEYAEFIENLQLIVPWPTLYETLRTRMVRRPEWVTRLDEQLKKPTVVFIDDGSYCVDAYSLTVEYSTQRKREISMVDMLCRLLIEDPDIRINYLLTTNPNDFRDVCATNGVVILP